VLSLLPALLLLLGGAGAPAASQEAPAPAPPLVLHGVNVLDPSSPEAIRNVPVVPPEGPIEAVGARTGPDLPAGARELELDGHWLVPGLLDAHSHLDTLEAARRALASGVTTIRTTGVGGYADVALRDAVRNGWLPGPETLAAGVYVTPAIGDGALADPRLAPFVAEPGDTPEELRRLVAVNADRGADWIKTRATERAGIPSTDPREQVDTGDELRAVVEEAASHGPRVAAHAHGDEGIAAAVRAGVASIGHGTYASEATLRLVRDRGTWLVPTLSSVLSFGQAGD
jgi:imidazolonepropionase-like amidohydrolase